MTDIKEELAEVETELSLLEVKLQELLERQSALQDRRRELRAVLKQQENSEQLEKNKSWGGTDFPWTEELDQKLKSVFKLNKLRPKQRETMNATLGKEDTLLIMPTGGGKSLCFQLPAIINKGVTLVVSPLVSLMEDQLMALKQLEIAAAMLNAATDKDELKSVQEDIVNPKGQLRLLYVTPEKLAKSKRFMNRLEKCHAIGHLSRIVIDEVHCCSQWGHDFRPDYKFLGILKRQFPDTPILGLTATATVKVLEDVKKILSIPRATLFKTSFNRPNLYYEVRPKPSTQKDTMDEIHHLVSHRYQELSGIIYCFSRKDSEEVAMELQSRGIKAACYHADIDARSRSSVHQQWLSGKIQIVVATVAFGMGIDKPDVRFVIHHTISKSMENLYQESGRSGRDDQRAECIVFYRLADVMRQSSMVFTEQTGLTNLHGIIKYCIDASSCRRTIIARHFGEVWDHSQCGRMCDHCEQADKNGPAEKRDVTKYCADVITLLDAAASTQQRVTAAKLIDAWYGRGPNSLKVKSVAVPGISRDKAERILAHMLVNGMLQEDFHFTAYSTICYIVPGPKAGMLRNNCRAVTMDFPAKLKVSSKTSSANSASSSTSPASSSSSSKSTTNQTSPRNSKPKLVMVNKEKSHFSSIATTSTLASSQTSSNSSSVKEDSAPQKHATNHERSFGSNGKSSGDNIANTSSNGDITVIDDDEDSDLNFDDSDEGNDDVKTGKVKKTSSTSSKTFEKSNNMEKAKVTKRKIFVVESSSEDEFDMPASKKKKKTS